MINQDFLKTLNVLYAEDSINIREQFSNILSKLFNKVIIAKDGQEALDKFLESKNTGFEVNIIISDINMPNMSGIELLEKIREVSIDIPFIITTAHTETDYLLQSIELNVTDYMVKPIEVKDLINKAQQVCQEKYHERLKKYVLQDLEHINNTVNEIALVIKTDLTQKITYVNNLFCKVSGYEQNEIIGQESEVIYHSDMKESITSNLYEEIKRGNIWDGNIKSISKSGDAYYVYTNIIPLYDESDIDIIEYMWICFLTTQEEEEKNEFKKKVAKNVKETRRINIQARQTIDELQTKLTKYKHFDMIEYALETELKRTSKFKSQIKYYEKEVKTIEGKFNSMDSEITVRINKANLLLKEHKDKRDSAVKIFDKINNELIARESKVKALNEEIAKQIESIDELKESIKSKEDLLETKNQ